MLMSDGEIRRALNIGDLDITPYDAADVQPASYDIHLAEKICRLASNKPMDPYQLEAVQWEEVYIPTHGLLVQPREFVLLSSIERFSFGSQIAGQLDGTSTLSRCGFAVHQTGQWIDPGFFGTLTLEASCNNGVGFWLYPKMRIGQVAFFRMGQRAQHPYAGRYQQQSGPAVPRSLRVRAVA